MDLFRDSTLGQLLRLVCQQEWLLYPEEREDFAGPYEAEKPAKLDEENCDCQSIPRDTSADSTHLGPANDAVGETGAEAGHSRGGSTSKFKSPEEDLEAGTADEKLREHPAVGNAREFRCDKGFILVDWYDERDLENPQNWSTGKKVFVTSVLWLYTFMVYCASAIYTPSIDGVREEYQVGHVTASLGLSLYVLGYGLGPMVFSPLSEIPRLGRNIPYITTLFLYVILAVPTVLVKSFAGFLVLRLVTGILGSPCLATGGATLQDMYSSRKLPYGYTAWVGATFCAPAIGPVLSGFAVASDWRWSMWEVLWMAVFTFIMILAAFPETSASTILLRRAQRLRKRFGDDRYKSASEASDSQKRLRKTVVEALFRPLQITVMDPAVLFTNLYSAYSYGVYYSFFEAFPLVYSDVYGFSTGLTGTAFLSIVIACLAGSLIFVCYVYYYLEPKIKSGRTGAHEERLIPAILASILQPIGLFLFAWTSRADIHWIASLIGISLFSTGGFILFQGIFMYLPLSYPDYAASLFATNDLFRSVWAAGAVLYATPLFNALGIARGVSLLAGLSCGGVLGVTALYMCGARLRARSKFAQS